MEFGGGKECCVSLALLETSPLCLKYQVASASCEAYVVGQKLHQTHKQVLPASLCSTASQPVSSNTACDWINVNCGRISLVLR